MESLSTVTVNCGRIGCCGNHPGIIFEVRSLIDYLLIILSRYKKVSRMTFGWLFNVLKYHHPNSWEHPESPKLLGILWEGGRSYIAYLEDKCLCSSQEEHESRIRGASEAPE